MADIFDIALGKALDSVGSAGSQGAAPSQDKVFDALIGQESGGKQFDKNGAPLASKAGAIGIAQVMPRTAPEAAKLAGVEYDEMRYRTDPEYNKSLGRAYYNKQLQDFDGDTARALAAYNAGPGRVRTALATAEKNGTPEAWMQYLPPETQQYVPSVLRRAGLGMPAAPSRDFVTPTGGEYVDAAKAREKATLADYGKELVASAVEGVGSMVQFAGEGAAALANKVTGSSDYEGFNPLKPASDTIRDSMTEGGKQARAGANVEGSVTDLLSGDAELPSSVDSWLMMAANGFGSLLTTLVPMAGPAARVASLTKAARAAEAAGDAAKAAELLKAAEAASRTSRAIGVGTGGAMTGGAAAEDVRQTAAASLSKMSHDQLMAEVPAYAEAFQATGDEQSARQAVVNNAAQYAALGAAAFGAAGGYLNARVLEDFVAKKGMAAVLGDSIASRAGRAAVGGGVGSLAEGGQEVTEKVGQNVGENIGLGRAADSNVLRNTAGDFLGGAIVGGGVGTVGGAMTGPSAQPVVPPALQPVAAKAAEPNSPLSKAAMAGNASALSAPAQPGVDPAQPGPAAGTLERAAPADDLVQRVRNLEEGMRNEGWLDNLRADGLDSRDVMLDMALARNINAPRRAREEALERIESATYFANRDAAPAAPMDSIQNNPAFDFTTPETQPAAPREVPSLEAVAGALRDPDLRGKISDQDRQQLLYLYNLANNSQGENNIRVNAAQQALEIVGRYQAPAGTRSAQGTPALEQAASAPAGSAAPTSQQNVESQPKELDFLTTAPAPKQARGPLGGDENTPAFLRKRSNVVRQLVDNGFETVARDGNTFFLTNTRTGQKFQLEGPADAQLARKAIKDRVDNLANTAAASPQNERLEPTEAQIAAGNYKKSDVIDLNGMRIKIENPQGSTRRGTSPDGKQWETKMAHHYGEFQGTVGADGDKLDVFVGPRPSDSKVFVIDQLNQDGSFDEHKVMMGFPTEEAARQGYLANYEPGWIGLGAITEMGVDEFKAWAKSRAAKKPVSNLVAQPAPAAAEGTATPAAPAVPAVPGAAVDAAISQPANFTAAEQAESAALPANQPTFLNVNDGSRQRKLRLIKSAELPKTASAPRPGEPRPLSQNEAGLIERIAGALGKQAVFYKAEDGRLADGFVFGGQPNTIFVASETTVNPLAVFGHEFFHTVRDTDPESWNTVAAVVASKVSNPRAFRLDRYGKKVADERGDAPLSAEVGGELEELVSDLGGNLLKDSKFWGEVFQKIRDEQGDDKAKGTIARLSAALQRLVTRLVNSLKQPGYKADAFVKDLDEVRAAFRTAMAGYMQKAGVPQMAMAAEQKRAEQQLKKSEDRPSISVTGYHFSPQARPTLSTAFYGTGLKGSARDEILSSADGRIRQRLSFYYDKGTGVRPESGVGGIAHKATLTNIYDADRDPLKLKGGNARAFESKVLDAGYSGYLARLEGTQPGQVILLGNQTVTPEVLGPRSRIGGDETGVAAAPAPAPAPIKKSLMSRELTELSVEAIPGATLRAGMLTVPPESVAQANAELERIGSPVRFSPDRDDAAQARREYTEVEARYKDTEQWLKAPNGKPTNLSGRQWVQVRTPSFKSWFGDWEAFAGTPGGVWADDKGAVSKAVDANGEPLVVYHGSRDGGFMEFSQPGGTRRGDLGIFTTSDEGMASAYVRRNRTRRVVEPSADADVQPGDQPGIYALFVNIRNPNEEHFEGANWDGARYEQYRVLNADGEPIYTDNGRAYLPEHEAQALADRNDGAVVEQAPEHYTTTDAVVREARRSNNDGAIIREVVDDGGGTGYSGDPADVFVAFEPNQVKSADFNGGSFSIDLDDIRFSAEREAVLEAAESLRFSVARPDQKVDPRHVPEFKFKDFIGRYLFATIADRTAAGGAFTGIDGAGAEAIPLQGGPGFPLLSRNFNLSVIWANEGPAVAGRKKNIIEQYGNPLMAVSLGELDMHKSNATAVLSYLYTLESYIAKGRVKLEALDAVTETIRKLKLGKDKKSDEDEDFDDVEGAEEVSTAVVNPNELAGFPGFRDRKELHAFIDGATFDARAAIVKELGKARSEEIGLPSADKVIRKLTDPEYAGARHFDTVLILEPSTKNTFVELGKQGTDRHLSYSYALKGKVVGKLRVPINAREIWSDWWRTQYQKKWDEKQRFQDAYNSGDASKLSKEEFKVYEKLVNSKRRLDKLLAGDFNALIGMDRAFALSMPVMQITPALAARLDALGEASTPNAATARAAVAFMKDDWSTSDVAKNKGGISPANFARELRQSDAAATLDLYSQQDLVEATRGWRWSEAGGKRVKEPVTKMRLFQLRDQRIQFALKYGKPFTYGVDVPGLTEDEVTLTSVVNNEPGVNGIGGPAIMLKAIAEGATFLDAYAVKSERFPAGFLPTLYNEYGFEEVARVPADPQYITDDHRYAWSQNGWKEGDPLPDIVMMKWKGSDEQRTGLLERYLREGAASLRRGEVGAPARGLARELAGQSDEAQRAEPSADRGAGGDQGTGDRASLASRAFKAVAQLRALNDDQLRNLGVDPAQVQRQPPQSTVKLSADRLTSVDRIKWRDIQDVKKEIKLDALPDHVAPFGDFMKYMARKAAVGAISPRDILKAYTITRSSVNRGAISTAKAISGGLQLPADFNEPTVRPEGAFAYWLLSPLGQDYLNDAELGIVNRAAVNDAVKAMAPFGMANTLGDDMVRAVDDDIGSLGLQISYIVNKAHAGTDMVSDWQRVLDDLYGIGYAKKGFMGAMLGYGQLPTFDARQINVQVEPESRRDVLNALGTKRAAEVVETLSRRLDALELSMDEEYLPFKQHLVHHAVWDAVGKSETTHSDVVDAMLRASADRKPEPETTLDEVPAAKAKGRKVTYEVEVEDTGDTARLTVDAGDALTDYDQRITTIGKLLECLKK